MRQMICFDAGCFLRFLCSAVIVPVWLVVASHSAHGVVIAFWGSESPSFHSTARSLHVMQRPWDYLTFFSLPDAAVAWPDDSNDVVTLFLGNVLHHITGAVQAATVWKGAELVELVVGGEPFQAVTLSTGQEFYFQLQVRDHHSQKLYGDFIILPDVSFDQNFLETSLSLVLTKFIQTHHPLESPVINISTDQSTVDVVLAEKATQFKLAQDDDRTITITPTQTSEVDEDTGTGCCPIKLQLRRRVISREEISLRSVGDESVLTVLQLEPVDWRYYLMDGEVPPERVFVMNNFFKNGVTYVGWRVGQVLGSGAFARVDELINPVNRSSHRAVRKTAIGMHGIQQLSGEQLLYRESLMLTGLNHPNIVKCLGGYKINDQFHMLMEHVQGEELFDFIKNDGTIRKPQVCTAIFRQLVSGLDYMHARRMVHRDIKPENLMLNPTDPGNSVKIIDFNLSVYQPEGIGLSTYVGSPFYAGPEVIAQRREKYDGFKNDIWSAGSVLYTMYFGEMPYIFDKDPAFNENDQVVRFRQNPANELYNRFDEISDPVIKNLVQSSAKKYPVQRLNASQLMQLSGIPRVLSRPACNRTIKL